MSACSRRWGFIPTAGRWSSTACRGRCPPAPRSRSRTADSRDAGLLHLMGILDPILGGVTDPEPRLAPIAHVAQPADRRTRLRDIVVAIHCRQRLELRAYMDRVAGQHNALMLQANFQRAFTGGMTGGFQHHQAAVTKNIG